MCQPHVSMLLLSSRTFSPIKTPTVGFVSVFLYSQRLMIEVVLWWVPTGKINDVRNSFPSPADGVFPPPPP